MHISPEEATVMASFLDITASVSKNLSALSGLLPTPQMPPDFVVKFQAIDTAKVL
jgi:hypothetical protein